MTKESLHGVQTIFSMRAFLRMAPALPEMLTHTPSSTWLTAAPCEIMGCACSELGISPVPWHGFGNGLMTSIHFQMHSWGRIAKTSLSIPIIAQRWSKTSRIWKGCNVPCQAKISLGTPMPAPRLWLWVWDPWWAVPVPHKPKASSLRCVDDVRVGRMTPCHEHFQGIVEQNGCSFLLMHWSGGKFQSNNVKQQ